MSVQLQWLVGIAAAVVIVIGGLIILDTAVRVAGEATRGFRAELQSAHERDLERRARQSDVDARKHRYGYTAPPDTYKDRAQCEVSGYVWHVSTLDRNDGWCSNASR